MPLAGYSIVQWTQLAKLPFNQGKKKTGQVFRFLY